jgi:hypothetical protein
MRTGQDVRSIPEGWLAREWLIANGLGGYSAGTAADIATRRTQALLVAASPHGRLVALLLRLDERLQVRGESLELSAHRFLADGCRLLDSSLEAFETDPWPTWRFGAAGVSLEKSLIPVAGHNALAIRYRHLGGPNARLMVSPVAVSRAPHALERVREIPGVAGGVPGRVHLALEEGAPGLTFWHNGAFLPAKVWRSGLAYLNDDDNTLGESGFVPGHVEATLVTGGQLLLVFADDPELFRTLAREDRLGAPPPPTLAGCVAMLEQTEREELAARTRAALAGAQHTAREAATAHGSAGVEPAARETASGAETNGDGPRHEPLVHGGDGWTSSLSRGLLAGLTRRGHRLTLLDRLPAPRERVAETLRAIPGLLAVRAFEPARAVLAGLLDYLNEGVAPESFDTEDGTPAYGAPEPSLWLIAASELYARRSEDTAFARDVLFPALEGVMQFYRSGTHYGIAVDSDGLLAVTRDAVSLKPSGLNALWAYALVAMAQLARLAGRRENGAFYLAWAHEHQRRFNEALWDAERGCLYEALRDEEPVAGLSAAQVLAVSLPRSLLADERPAILTATLERELATPLGLRAVPDEPEVETRWLGAYHAARLRVGGRGAGIQARVKADYAALRHVLVRCGEPWRIPERFILSERRPAGATHDALAAGELLRVWIEEVEHAEPPVPAGLPW